MECVVAGSEVDGAGLRVRLAPVRGSTREVEDRIPFAPAGDVAVVAAVGRFLRILRAARVRPPRDPYRLYDDLEAAAALVERCRGARVRIEVRPSFDRSLTVWTDTGVERIAGVVDVNDEGDALAVRRRGGQSPLRIPRQTLIRYELSTTETLRVISVDVPSQFQLP